MRVKTLRLVVDPANLESSEAEEALERAAEILRDGGLVALPTETVYGLGANALDAAAVGRIFAAKQRPAWDPVIVHVANHAEVAGLTLGIPGAAMKLIGFYWPGPLTLLLPRSKAVPEIVTAGRMMVGVRMPRHPVALELIRRAGVPIAAPSANLFGHTSPTCAEHVRGGGRADVAKQIRAGRGHRNPGQTDQLQRHRMRRHAHPHQRAPRRHRIRHRRRAP